MKGETVAIVGESGSGKSVTMKAAMGILASNATVTNGKRIAMVFQEPMTSLDPTMTIGKQIMEGMIWHFKTPKKETWNKAVELQKEVGIARALIMDPKLIIADECISALDVSIQAQVVNLMKDIQQETGTAYLFIAHDLSMVKYISDRIGVLHLGHLLETGTTECEVHR